MFGFLKQSTATQGRLVGPFVDDTDFKALETSLTINNTDVKLSKNGAASVDKNSGGGTHRINGMYELVFNATDTSIVGELTGSIFVSGALIVAFKFWVLEELIYDALFGASAAGFDSSGNVTLAAVTHTGAIVPTVTTLTNLPSIPANWLTATGIDAAAFTEPKFGADFLTSAKIADDAFLAINFAASSLDGKGDWNVDKTGYSLTLADWNVGKSGYSLTQAFPSNFADMAIAITTGIVDVDVLAINNSSTAATQLALSAAAIENGTCEATPTTTVIQTDLAETDDLIYIGRTMIFTGGAARGEATDILGYVGSSGTLTVTELANAPASSDPFIIL